MGRDKKIIACPSETGAGKSGTAQGVVKLAELFEDRIPISFAPAANKAGEGRSFPNAKNIEQITHNLVAAYHTVEKELSEGNFCCSLTGDHSNAIATVSAFSDRYGADSTGVIWVDAHADMHSPYTTPSGNIHGMPLAALMGMDNRERAINEVDTELAAWWGRLKNIGLKGSVPKLLPQNLVLIGLRDLEKEEKVLISKHNIRYFAPQNIKEEGIEVVLEKALAHLNECENLYCSFDIDALDASLVAGTGTPVSNGLMTEEAVLLLKKVWESPKLKSFEITEFNPVLDTRNKTLNVVKKLLEQSFFNRQLTVSHIK